MCNIIFICRIYELCYICSMSFINKLGIHKPKYTHTTLLSIHSSGISLELNGPIWDAISSVFFTSDEFLVYYFASVVMIINISFVILERDHQENLWCGILWNNVRYVATNCRRLWFIYSSTWTTTSPHRTLSSVCYFCFFLCSVYLWTIAVDEKKKGSNNRSRPLIIIYRLTLRKKNNTNGNNLHVCNGICSMYSYCMQ